MSSSAINQSVFQAKIGSVQNDADSSAVYSAGVWSFKNSTAVTGVTITNAGNVGVGVTPSAWGASNSGHLQLQDGVTYGRYGYIRNAYFDGASWRYIDTGLASQYLQAAGMHQWFTAPSGTAGNAITYTERMRIDASGNLLVNTSTAPSISSSTPALTLKSSAIATVWGVGPTNAFGNFYVTTGTNGVYLTSSGTAWVSNSDQRMKKNIQPLELGLEQIKALKPSRFDYNTDESEESARIGFIAQEVLSVLPHAVHAPEDAEQMMGVSATEMIPVLVKAVQELSAKVDAQAEEIKALKAK